MPQDLVVRHVAGRDPLRGVLRGSTVVATVEEVARVYRIRLDDAAIPNAWLEITVELETGERPCSRKGTP